MTAYPLSVPLPWHAGLWAGVEAGPATCGLCGEDYSPGVPCACHPAFHADSNDEDDE